MSPSVTMSRNQVISKRAIEWMISEGRSLVIYEGQVLQLDTWMDRHPGGRLALQHMVGNDATSEIKAWVSISTFNGVDLG